MLVPNFSPILSNTFHLSPSLPPFLPLSLSLSSSSPSSLSLSFSFPFPPLSLLPSLSLSLSLPLPLQYNSAVLDSYVSSNSQLTWCHNPAPCDQILLRGEGVNSGTCRKCRWCSCFLCDYKEVRIYTLYTHTVYSRTSIPLFASFH